MTEEEIAKYQYRFGGYRLRMIQLDSTGPSYPVMDVHPYYVNQPKSWERNHFYGHPNGDGYNYIAKERLYPFASNDENT